MAEGYEVDESKLLDLLYDYYSEDGRRTRRNLSVFSLTIIIPNLLGLAKSTGAPAAPVIARMPDRRRAALCSP